MPRSISVGIDVGTRHVKVVVIESLEEQKIRNKVIGTGTAEAKGMQQGYVSNPKEASRSINQALKLAEKNSGVKIQKVYVAINGVGLLAQVFHGMVSIGRTDNEINQNDLAKVSENARTEIPDALIQNRRILHSFPLQYKIDGKTVHGHPEGLKGNKLEVKILAITSLTHHLSDLISAVEGAGVRVEDIVAGPLVASSNNISKAEKKAGVAVANIGAETLSLVVYEDNIPISMEIFPFASNNITNDIALGLKIPLDEAEEVKLGHKQGLYSKKKIDEIVNARLSDLFELIENHLKKISKSGLLPAGIVLLGGGSKLPGIDNFAKNYLKLPSRKIEERPEWAVAYGASVFGMSPEDNDFPQDDSDGVIGDNFIDTLKRWVRQFLP
jgi:cell division protein FtsA